MAVRVYEHADGTVTFSVTYRDPEGTQRVEPFKVLPATATRTERKAVHAAAVVQANKRRAAAKNGDWKPLGWRKPRPPLLHADMTAWARDVRSRRAARNTYYVERAKSILKTFPDKLLTEVTVADIERYARRAVDAGKSSETVRKDLGVLSQYFASRVRAGLLDTNPAAADVVRRPAKSAPNPQPYSEGEAVALLDAAPPWFGLVLTFALETGADLAEIVRLTWGRHVLPERRLIVLARGKTGVGRSLPYQRAAALRRVLGAAARTAPGPRPAGGWPQDGRVFLGAGGGSLTVAGCKSAMKRTLQAAGMAGRVKPWKSLRATFATNRVMAGVDVSSLAALMGLTTAHVLEHYVKPTGAHLADALAARAPQKRGADVTKSVTTDRRRA